MATLRKKYPPSDSDFGTSGKFFGATPGQSNPWYRTQSEALRGTRKRIKPFRDEKILTSWNGLMLSGLAEAIKISRNPAYLEAANRTVDFIFTKMFRDGRLLHTYKNGTGKILGYLDDYAFLAAGLWISSRRL